MQYCRNPFVVLVRVDEQGIGRCLKCVLWRIEHMWGLAPALEEYATFWGVQTRAKCQLRGEDSTFLRTKICPSGVGQTGLHWDGFLRIRASAHLEHSGLHLCYCTQGGQESILGHQDHGIINLAEESCVQICHVSKP